MPANHNVYFIQDVLHAALYIYDLHKYILWCIHILVHTNIYACSFVHLYTVGWGHVGTWSEANLVSAVCGQAGHSCETGPCVLI